MLQGLGLGHGLGHGLPGILHGLDGGLGHGLRELPQGEEGYPLGGYKEPILPELPGDKPA